MPHKKEKASMRNAGNGPFYRRAAVKAGSLPRPDAMDWWALSLGVAAGCAALLIIVTQSDGPAAAGVLAGMALLIGCMMWTRERAHPRR